jgi:hypothetical protein
MSRDEVLNMWWPKPLFLDIYFIGIGTIWRLMMRRLVQTIHYFGWGLLVVLSARCGLEAWMPWSCIDVTVLGFKGTVA